MRAVRLLTAVGTGLAVAGTAHTAINLRLITRPSASDDAISERVSVLLPMRNEAQHAHACLESVVNQRGVNDLEILVLDDGSTDGTAEIARGALAGHAHSRVIDGSDDPLPAGWLGKPWACERLTRAAGGSVLVFIDADVVLEPTALAQAISLLRSMQADLISPYPRQLADGLLPRLIQPLLQWSWLTTVPLRASEVSRRESLAVANGQFLVADSAVLLRTGGFAAVRAEVLDDVALMRAVKRAGGRGTVVDGTSLATCRMYATGSELVDGYTKSLWSAFGSPIGSTAVMASLALAYVVPPVAAVTARSPLTRAIGLAGYTAAVAGRVMVARRTQQRVLPDALAHPVSIVTLATLTAMSWNRRRRGTLTWKGRHVTVDGSSS